MEIMTVVFWYFLIISHGEWRVKQVGAFMQKEACVYYQRNNAKHAEEDNKHVTKCFEVKYSYDKKFESYNPLEGPFSDGPLQLPGGHP